jgi:hypothetical protein
VRAARTPTPPPPHFIGEGLPKPNNKPAASQFLAKLIPLKRKLVVELWVNGPSLGYLSVPPSAPVLIQLMCLQSPTLRTPRIRERQYSRRHFGFRSSTGLQCNISQPRRPHFDFVEAGYEQTRIHTRTANHSLVQNSYTLQSLEIQLINTSVQIYVIISRRCDPGPNPGGYVVACLKLHTIDLISMV